MLTQSRVLAFFIAGCMAACGLDDQAVETATVQHVGLRTNAAIPPLGVGVPPRAGDAGDGAPAVTQVGSPTSAGSIRWHGGQWVVPITVPPGATLQNAMCSVLTNSTSTDLVELVSSNGGVIASSVVPAATGLNVWAWLVPTTTHVTVDGEQWVIRHSPRDATTGAWTSASQDLTIISCTVNATASHTISVDATAFNAITAATSVDHSNGCSFSGGVGVQAHLILPQGSAINAVRFYVTDNTATILQGGLLSRDTAGVRSGFITGGSNGSHTNQVLSPVLHGAVSINPQTGYYLQVFYFSGNATSSLAFAEVDYN